MARRPPKPALVTRALKLCETMTPTEAAEKLRHEGHAVSSRSIYEWAKGRNGAQVLVTPGAPPPASEPVAVVKVTPEPAAPPAEPPPIPEHLDGAARRLWIIRSRIDATRRALARADVELGGLGRIGTLTGQLVDLLGQEERLAPPAPADPHEEERRHRAAADACVAKIKAGIRAAKVA